MSDNNSKGAEPFKNVISALERQVRLEEAAITANKIEKDQRRSLPGYKGPELHRESPEYIEELKRAIKILKVHPLTNEHEGVKRRCEKEKFVEQYFGFSEDITEQTPINTDFGQLVNLLAMYRDALLVSTQTTVAGGEKIKVYVPIELVKEPEQTGWYNIITTSAMPASCGRLFFQKNIGEWEINDTSNSAVAYYNNREELFWLKEVEITMPMAQGDDWIEIGSENDDVQEIEVCLWCRTPVEEPPYAGSMIDEDFPGLEYFTHYRRMKNDFFPEPPKQIDHGK